MSPLEARRGKSRFNGPRGAGLFCAGLVCMFRGLFLLPFSHTPPATPSSGLESLSAGWPPALLIYSLVWWGAGGYAVICAFRTRDALACAAVFGTCAVWGIGYLLAGVQTWWGFASWDLPWWGLDFARREWQAAAGFLGTALLGGYWSRMVNPVRQVAEGD